MVYSTINVACLERNVNETDICLFFPPKRPLILIIRSLQNDVKFTHETELFNPLNAELNPMYHLLALLGARYIFHVSRIRVKAETERKSTSLMASGLFECLLIYFHNILFGTV